MRKRSGVSTVSAVCRKRDRSGADRDLVSPGADADGHGHRRDDHEDGGEAEADQKQRPPAGAGALPGIAKELGSELRVARRSSEDGIGLERRGHPSSSGLGLRTRSS
jgi:hypothetical protein